MSQKDRTEMEKKTFHAAETFNGRTEQLKEYLRRLVQARRWKVSGQIL